MSELRRVRSLKDGDKLVGSSSRLSSDEEQYFIGLTGLNVCCVSIGSAF